MAGETDDAGWPLPKLHFSVAGFPSGTVSFQEVTGLGTENAPIEYRHGDSPVFSSIKMPGLGKVGNVTLRKGVFANDTALWTWIDQIRLNTIAPTTVVISLLDESAAPKRVWTLNNAVPVKVTGTDVMSEGNEVAVESVDLAFETIIISAP